MFSCKMWACFQSHRLNNSPVGFVFPFQPPQNHFKLFSLLCRLAHKSNWLHEEELLLCSERCERALVLSAHIPADTNTPTQTSLASTCRQCGEEIRLHQMHNAVLISMPTNLTQSKKVTLCRNQKEASLFQNCMLGSLQADRFSEWDSLKRNVFHLWLTTSCSRQNWKTILISDQSNGSDTGVRKGNFFCLLPFQKRSLGLLSCMAKVHPLHTGVGVNLILSAPCHAVQTQSVAFVRLCGSVRHDKQGNNSNLGGWWADFTAFLWLGVMTVKMGALEGVFDVFVLFRAGSGSPLHALMSWCGVWCWPSNLLWCSGPCAHPSYPAFLFFTQTHSLHTQSTSHTHAHSFTSAVGGGPPRSPASTADDEMRKNAHVCLFFYVCMKGGGWVGAEYGTSMCACFHMYVDSENREWDVMKLLPDLLLYILLMIISSFFFFFFLVFFPVLSPSPLKKKTLRFLFRQPARPSKCTIAFLCELSCFPVC